MHSLALQYWWHFIRCFSSNSILWIALALYSLMELWNAHDWRGIAVAYRDGTRVSIWWLSLFPKESFGDCQQLPLINTSVLFGPLQGESIFYIFDRLVELSILQRQRDYDCAAIRALLANVLSAVEESLNNDVACRWQNERDQQCLLASSSEPVARIRSVEEQTKYNLWTLWTSSMVSPIWEIVLRVH